MRVVQGAIAILAGWIVMSAGYLATMAISGFIDSEGFAPGSQLSWCGIVFVFAVLYGSALIGGFVTGVIARRNEVKHAIGLVLFTWLAISGLFLLFAKGDSKVSLAHPYTIAAYLLLCPSILIGGWLRGRQRIRSRVDSCVQAGIKP